MADIKVRVGQQNAIKIISAQAGLGTDLTVNNATNVIGGIGSVTTLNVSGIATYQDNVFIDGTLAAGLIDGGSF